MGHMQSYVGESFTGNAREQAPPLPLPDVSDFEMLASPARYDVFETSKGPEILPVMRTVAHRGGTHGIVPYRNFVAPGRTGDAMTYIATQTRPAPAGPGFVHIPQSATIVAFGEKRQGFTHGFPTKGGGYHFADVWRRPYMVGDEVSWDRDVDGYHDFLRMVQREYLPPIDKAVVKALKSKLSRMLDDAKRADRSDTTEKLQGKLKVFAPKKPRSRRKPEAPADA